MAEDVKLQWGLPPDCKEPIEFGEFLKKAAKDPSLFDNVWQRAYRKCIDGGSYDPKDDPYLLMLAAQGIKSWKVFDGIEGNEYSVNDIFETEPVDLMVGLIGPTGSGKSILLDRYVSLVLGETFWMVYGCRNNCSPESLLRLLDEGQLKKQSKEYGDPAALTKLRARAVDICHGCKEHIFGTRDKPEANPALDKVKIQAVQLQARKGYGLAYWTPSASDNNPGVPLEDALKEGTHLFVMRQPFAEKGKAATGKISQFHPLLEAVAGGRRLSDGTPCKTQVLFENNDGGFKNFRSNASDDPGTYLRRMRVVPKPYLSAVSRELRIYKRYLDSLDVCPKFDPYVLESIAVTAVFSRVSRKKSLSVSNSDGVPDLSITERMRVYDGDLALLELLFKKHTKQLNLRPIYTAAADHNYNLKQMMERLVNAAGGDYCFEGLSPQFMLDNIIQPLSEEGLNFPGQRVTFVIANDFMIKKITEQRSIKDSDAAEDQKKMYEAVLTELALAKGPGDVKTIEAWYRRRLRHAMELAFYPNRDELRDARFDLYLSVATALAVDESHYINLSGERALITDKIKEKVLTPIERTTLGFSEDETKEFRAKLKDRVNLYLAAEAARMGVSVGDVDANHETLPELKRAIAMLEGEDHFKKIGLCLDEKERQGKPLDVDDSNRLQKAIANLKALGYSDESLESMLNYFRSFNLWRDWNGSSGHDVY